MQILIYYRNMTVLLDTLTALLDGIVQAAADFLTS